MLLRVLLRGSYLHCGAMLPDGGRMYVALQLTDETALPFLTEVYDYVGIDQERDSLV